MIARAGHDPRLHGIYALIDPDRVEPIAFTEALLRGGIRLVQVRAKNGIDGATLIAIVTRVRAAGGLTIVNDDVALARVADGVHLGQDDARAYRLADVRRALGPRIIGLSCGTADEARAADPALIDYIGVGPAYATASKADARPPIGPAGVAAVAGASSLPAAAIGGIGAAEMSAMRGTGAAMAAVISALLTADPEGAARDLVAAWG